MKTRRLRNIAINEISILFFPEKPAVPAAKLVMLKNDSFFERPEVKSILRQLDKVVQGMKLEQAQRELSAALEKEAAKRPQRIRVRHYNDYDSYQASEDQARRMNARAVFAQECLETGMRNAGKQSDLGK